MSQFQDKVFIIAGASSGIGARTAIELSLKGANVVLLARRREKLIEVSKQLSTSYLLIECDVTDSIALSNAFAETLEKFARIDGIIANAGFSVLGSIDKLSMDDFRRQFETNVFAIVNFVKLGLPELKKTQGQITIIGSVAGSLPCPMGAAYGMSKRALESFAEALTLELLPHSITVTLILPGFVESEIFYVNNQGQYNPEKRKNIPIGPWFMSTDRAAKKIVNAIRKGKRQSILSMYGWFFIRLYHLFPQVVFFTLTRKFLRKYILKDRI